MNFDEYQREAQRSDQKPGNDPANMVIPILGLVAEAGSIANLSKKWLRDGLTLEKHRDFVKTELGDVLWYAANIATRFDLSLADVAQSNLTRTESRYGFGQDRWSVEPVTRVLDSGVPEEERFPRKLLFRFSEVSDPDGQPLATMILETAEPNVFPSGRDFRDDKKGRGFSLGDALRNNSVDDDGYRYHDAIHIAFVANLGWSPVLRSLMRLKRKSSPTTDDTEDSARAIDVEEGLSTQLAERAPDFGGFLQEQFVDNETLDIVLEHVRPYEVNVRPGWLWKKAIAEGFQCMKALADHKGGYVLADLDARRASYSKLKP
jgi:NTP pyrophosphatase (non-canonical NTP hydrolase)